MRITEIFLLLSVCILTSCNKEGLIPPSSPPPPIAVSLSSLSNSVAVKDENQCTSCISFGSEGVELLLPNEIHKPGVVMGLFGKGSYNVRFKHFGRIIGTQKLVSLPKSEIQKLEVAVPSNVVKQGFNSLIIQSDFGGVESKLVYIIFDGKSSIDQ